MNVPTQPMDTDNLAVHSLVEQLKGYGHRHFSGTLEVQSAKGLIWRVHYLVGRFVWATGGSHRVRRWRRHLSQQGLQVDPTQVFLRESDRYDIWDYLILSVLFQRQVASRDQIVAVIQGVLLEVLFDLVQLASVHEMRYCHDHQGELSSAITVFATDPLIDRAAEEWQRWRNAGISDYSPNLAPFLKRPAQLQREAPASTYKTLVTVVDGRRSLREIAQWMQKDLLGLTQSLMAYYHRGLVGLEEVPDLRTPEFIAPHLPLASASIPEDSRLLVTCIDDSKHVCFMLEQIVTTAGYAFMAIREPIQVLPTLLKQKPDLILLDLMMPVINGYELCAQIRRIPEFQSIPIIILTGNDGFVDRLRTKITGATNFLSKSAGTERILAMIQKYLPAQIDADVSLQDVLLTIDPLLSVDHADDHTQDGTQDPPSVPAE
ncbi:MAG: response regulator [Oscillatoriales cyanobacterium SM2_2_1]|nr:response regulator [Oscillatoriales cyanobacterium SM2_2_1]